ncbi:unnamed protein product [Clonostachys solani]|uniref:Uncharacterized protein n=1 Tax=Clonostachys solani TaxID=160281 RepID=A0A9P0EGT6_9HYPO|nr:unnamed protein product [Clonostachys solani]
MTVQIVFFYATDISSADRRNRRRNQKSKMWPVSTLALFGCMGRGGGVFEARHVVITKGCACEMSQAAGTAGIGKKGRRSRIDDKEDEA